jgi:hypothetical protein
MSAQPQVFPNPRGVQPQDSETPIMSDSSIAQTNPLGTSDTTSAVPHAIQAGSPEAAYQLAERGAPRDMERWGGREADALMNDKEAWDEEDTNARGLDRSKLHLTHTEEEAPKASLARNKAWAKSGPYVTKLSPAQEAQFQKEEGNSEEQGPNADYDERGRWLADKNGDPEAKRVLSDYDGKMHSSDKWKTPFHRTFSNESIYATPDAPKWDGDRLIDKSGHVVADETPKSVTVQFPATKTHPQGPIVSFPDEATAQQNSASVWQQLKKVRRHAVRRVPWERSQRRGPNDNGPAVSHCRQRHGEAERR